MRVGAPSGSLRNWTQPYGAQQARNLLNARQCEGGILRAYVIHRLLYSVNNYTNKGWERPVPAAAVTPAPQVAIVFIGPKASVAG